MKIALLAPIKEPVPPIKYGPIQLYIDLLAKEFTHLGHETVVYCTGDSPKSDIYEKYFMLDKSYTDAIYPKDLITQKEKEAKRNAFEDMNKRNFDIIHNHTGYGFIARYKNKFKSKIVTTVRWTLEDEEARKKFLNLENSYITVLSDFQKQYLDGAKSKVYRVYNGQDPDAFKFNPNSKNYVCFLGRIDPRKGIEEAIEFSKRTGKKLLIGARIDLEFKDYFEQKIKPELNDNIVYLGELDMAQKNEMLSSAEAFLFPASTNEAFGNVLIEANACGTPVLSYITGSTPEIIQDGVNGYLCKDLEDMIEKSKLIPNIKRSDCRKVFEEKFTSSVMAQNYIKVFEEILQS